MERNLTILDLINLKTNYCIQTVIEGDKQDVFFTMEDGIGETFYGDPNKNDINDVLRTAGFLPYD